MSFGFQTFMVIPTQTQNKSALWQALGLAWELGYTIAVPLVALALVGRLLDKYWGTSPWMLLIGVLLSIVISSVLVVRKTQKIMAETLAEVDNKKTTTDKKPPQPNDSSVKNEQV